MARNKTITAIRNMLSEHGYLTAKQIQTGLGYKSSGAVAHALNRYIKQGKLKRIEVLGLKAYAIAEDNGEIETCRVIQFKQ
ncbi:hypothetical protein JCM18904_1883 [Vibrio sp. JCM 18904]|nr:hypothetical protein JCM18904_1883 [Vibrio sp. JCM 18904]